MKINILISVACLIGLVSCKDVNSSTETAVTTGNDTLAEAEISISKTDVLVNTIEELSKETESTLLFKASGFEPGWLIEVYNNKLKLVVDYGNDSLIIKNTFENLNSEKGYAYSYNSDFFFSIINKPCTDEATGDKKNRTVTVKYKGKEYKGCGSL